MDIHGFVQSAIPLLTAFGLKVIGAIVLWVIGRKLIRFARVLVVRSLKYPFDQTVATYIGTALSVILTITLIIALLGFFGIETTSFAALLAGVGIAIGAAWTGLRRLPPHPSPLQGRRLHLGRGHRGDGG
jgi:small conductance mechanosensitive channel